MSRFLDLQRLCPRQQRWTAMLFARWKRRSPLSIHRSHGAYLKPFDDEDE
jgi:hypothetical protein